MAIFSPRLFISERTGAVTALRGVVIGAFVLSKGVPEGKLDDVLRERYCQSGESTLHETGVPQES